MNDVATPRGGMRWNALVPELMVSDFDTSLRFYVDVLGFAVCYSRDDPLFAYLEREGAQLMLEQYRDDGWLTAPLHAPFGRGMNLQIECSDATTLRDRVVAAGGEASYELADHPYGERSGGVRDAWGNHWFIATMTDLVQRTTLPSD